MIRSLGGAGINAFVRLVRMLYMGCLAAPGMPLRCLGWMPRYGLHSLGVLWGRISSKGCPCSPCRRG